MKTVPHAEYPRPQLRREHWENLNGEWEYAFRATEDRPITYDGTILVPFSPETEMSGVGRTLRPGEYLHYRRQISTKAPGEGWHLLLHFGAVDERCAVFVNGQCAGGHRGGYLSFSMEITPYLSPEGEAEITVVVQDDTDEGWAARGKQKSEPGGMFYPGQSGIWKTVWMEWVPPVYIESVVMEPRLDEGCLALRVTLGGAIEAGAEQNAAIEDSTAQAAAEQNAAIEDSTARAGAETTGYAIRAAAYSGNEKCGEAALENGKETLVKISPLRLWSPEEPHLYDLEITAGEDRVESYFAMRKFSLGRDARGIPRFMLNGRPYFMNGVLDQGYWPQSLMTPPDDRAMVLDIRRMKRLGFNMLRKHVKVECDRWYYHCDRLGMLVWQDAVNGGGKYDMNFVCNLPTVFTAMQRMVKDDHGYARFAREDPEGREAFVRELGEMIEQLRNVPSLCVWGPFNEGWGQFDARRVTALIRKADRTRLIDQASGWFDQGGGDFRSIHNYFRVLTVRPGRRIAAVTEYGGYSCLSPGHAKRNDMKAYRKFDTPEALMAAYEKLILRDILRQIPNGLGAAVYTQLSDVEDEVNGIYTYDRELLKLDMRTVRRLNRAVQRVFEKSVAGAGKRV